MTEISLEELLNQHQQRIELLENAVARMVDHLQAQDHLIHVLARQMQMVASETGTDIRMSFMQ